MTVELDDRLRELFADERLDLPAPPDAADGIVAGARRRRQTRIAVAATFSLTLLVGGGAVASGLGLNLVSRPAAPAPATVVETVTVSRTPVEPGAYATYRLGMTGQELRDVNPRVRLTRTGADGCEVYALDGVAGDAVVVSPTGGAVWIRLPPRGVTPSGVLVGREVEEVTSAYPQARREGDRITVAMPGPPPWRYAFPLEGERVSAVLMEAAAHDCEVGDR